MTSPDMFNDEIDGVRIDAIQSLRKMGDRVKLREEQLHVVLAVLDDTSVAVRHAAHQLLGCIPLANVTCLLATIQALMTYLRAHTEDQDSVFTCLKQLAVRHAAFTEFIVNDLLRIDARFAGVEPSTEDIFYVSAMIVCLNAAAANPSILSLLPKYCFWHAQYLSDKYPSFIPADVTTQRAVLRQPVGTSSFNVATFLVQSLCLVKNLENLVSSDKFEEVQLNIRECARNLKRVCVLSSRLEGTAKAYILYLKILVLVIALKRERRQRNDSGGRVTQGGNIPRSLVGLTYALQHGFEGLCPRIHATLHALRYVARLAAFVSRTAPPTARELESLRAQLTDLQRFCQARRVDFAEFSSLVTSTDLVIPLEKYFPTPVFEQHEMLAKEAKASLQWALPQQGADTAASLSASPLLFPPTSLSSDAPVAEVPPVALQLPLRLTVRARVEDAAAHASLFLRVQTTAAAPPLWQYFPLQLAAVTPVKANVVEARFDVAVSPTLVGDAERTDLQVVLVKLFQVESAELAGVLHGCAADAATVNRAGHDGRVCLVECSATPTAALQLSELLTVTLQRGQGVGRR
eukprot:TRINITY_DN3883_c0_g1_i4.p1 TRINITY_DN3883_c0_g1~~TRINITY_DN3883_c0_g1_i4.p1  ORF type:complete len:576 (+),score=150.30 TRINITY_DN3883_c0_g1_i4:1267-2994(+)